MKVHLCILLAFLMIAAVYAADPEPDQEYERQYGNGDMCFENVRVQIDDGSVILINQDDDDERVEFTKDYDLLINGDYIKLNHKQQKLVKEFHSLSFDLIDEAKNIGLEGAKVGISGAALGLVAVSNVFKLLSPDYDSEDFEREMEEQAEKLEKKAEKLEEKAEELEEIADELDEIRDDLQKITPELQDYEWF